MRNYKPIKILQSLVVLASLSVNVSSNEICTLVSSQPFGYTGDITGKRIYTKEEFTYECVSTRDIQGACVRWNNERDINLNMRNMEPTKYYKSENFQGSIGEALATAQAYDKINGLWSGWHGLCIIGADDGNWDWLSDPYVLAGMAMSAISGGVGMWADGVSQSANAMQTSVRVAKKAQEISQIVNYATCATRAGLDVGKMVEDYASDGEPCDPIDEFCGKESEAEDDTNIYTIPEDEFNKLVTNNPDTVDYYEIIEGVGTGVLTVKIKNANVDTTDLDSAAAKEAEKKMKEMKLKMDAAMTSIQLASCVAGYDSGSGASASSGGSLTSASNLAGMALGAINPLLGLAAQALSNVYESMVSKIDTCNNLEEAKEKGKRHEATNHAIKTDMCHLIEVRESGDSLLNTKQKRYRYCCYDHKLTRIIVEQAKAQFAKNWDHCTDITLKELQLMSFSACDPNSLDAGVDGVNLPVDATTSQRMQAYQFTQKCIDTREILSDMVEKYGGDSMMLDSSDAEKILEDLKP